MSAQNLGSESIWKYKSSLSDAEFQQQFEDKTLNPDEFDHKGHLRIAWLYLSQQPLLQATNSVCSGIKAYAESLGAKDKFHYTLTVATVRLISERMDSGNYRHFYELLKNNTDLITALKQLIAKQYSEELLNSERARNEYVEPDRI
ncbi:hypothetical protein KIH87_02260 [Paraneptunicella aestuarii]|uniref:hypothetical protein n=1 Tax=Paraneptunicella aestuarii TaxID=2831148 RepID=UPI001E54972C|nr:hypothetical protein [Paraneptunicella aestuarii]UAA39208.1 hypothetical protein KIH87_02260 [Paraneptunicella aestuarii]